MAQQKLCFNSASISRIPPQLHLYVSDSILAGSTGLERSEEHVLEDWRGIFSSTGAISIVQTM